MAHRNILVVEDEQIVRNLLTNVLRRAGYQVYEAPNGLAALEWLEHEPVDLVITDLRMPLMDGLTFLRQCRERFPNIDVIVLTAYGTVNSAVEALKLGAVDYLTKPFEITDLLNRVELAFQRHHEQLAQAVSPTTALLELNRIISGAPDLDGLLAQVLDLLQKAFSAAFVRIRLWLNPLLSEGPKGDLSQGEPLLLPDFTPTEAIELAHSPVPWAFSEGELASNGFRLNGGHGLTVPVAIRDQVMGVIQVARMQDQPRYTEIEAQLLHVFGTQVALAVQNLGIQAQLHMTFGNLEKVTISAVRSLVEALGAFDPATREHSYRVAHFARRFAEALGWDEPTCERVEIAALLHDIGKLSVGESTLNKNGKLTEQEMARIRQHPAQGARILAGLDNLAEIVPLVRWHHERYDGKGYPDGLKGEEIPIEARLLAIVDAYDSMISDRPYRKRLTPEEALERLQEGAGSQFDPHLVQEWVHVVRGFLLERTLEEEYA